MEFANNLEEEEKKDKFKTKVMKFVLYKKRTISEVRKKFENYEDAEYLDEIIDFLKEYNYLNDEDYIERSIEEFKNLKNLSVKEVRYKLMQKDVEKNILEKYFIEHEDELFEYELNSAKNIISKKIKEMDVKDIKNYLYRKGYTSETVNKAINEYNENV